MLRPAGWETARSRWTAPDRLDNPISAPAGVTTPPRAALRKSRRRLERRYSNVVYFNETPAGGHFFALEQPDTLVNDVRATFALLRQPLIDVV